MSSSATIVDTPAWSGQDVAIADVVKAVDKLRHNEQKAASRTSIATLVIVTRNPDELDEAETVIDHLGARHPARIVTLMMAPEAVRDEDRVDADVVLHAAEAAGHAIWSDEIRLRVRGGPSRHPASLLRPLLLSDLPVLVWYVHGLPNEKDPLLKLADGVILDSKSAIDAGEGERAMQQTFAEIAALTRRHTIVDLSWTRLAVWRRLLASQFQGEIFGPMIDGVKSVSITGKLGPRTLLAGWLASRLSIPRESMSLYDGRHVAVTLECQTGSERGTFTVKRLENDRLVEASANLLDGPSHKEVLGLPDDTLPQSLLSSLRSIQRDRIYEMAIKTIGDWT